MEPSNTQLRQDIRGLSDQARVDLEQQLIARIGPRRQTIERHQLDGPVPASFAQQRLWTLSQVDPGSPAYNISLPLRLIGDLNRCVLEHALQEIVHRHSVLRTTLHLRKDEVVQVVRDTIVVEIRHLHLHGSEDQTRREQAQAIFREEACRPFDLSSDCMLRACLAAINPTEHLLLLTTHHAASDGWSLGIFFREMVDIYAAHCEDRPSSLAPLPIQYADFAVWQRQWLQGERLEQQLAYWKNSLAGAPPVLTLPTDKERPVFPTYQGAAVVTHIPMTLSSQLEALSRASGATLFMTLLAAFNILLSRYSGQEDIVVGSPIANRNRKEIEGLIGYFANTLALRTDLSGNPTFRELLGRVRETALGAYTHQDLPFEKLVDELQPERSTSHAPIFQVAFILQNTPTQVLELPGLTLSRFDTDSITAKVDLHLTARETAEGLRITLTYDTALFHAETMARMLGHFQTLLEGIVANPEHRLSRLSMLSASERQQMLVEWNATERVYPQQCCLHELFEEQVERTPEAVALLFGDRSLSYRELNRRANQLAHYLQNLGVGPDVPVGLCFERSVEMVVGVLGVLKAGGAYVPLDPSYPLDRLAFMLEDAQAPILLSHLECIDALRSTGAREIRLDADWEQIGAESTDNPISGACVDNLAYIIYTSGSTGLPKGVLVTHRGLGNISLSQAHLLGIDAASRVLQFASLSFDASVFEIVMALSCGATLCIGQREALLPGADLAHFLDTQAISVVTLPPTALSALPWQAYPALKTILVAGEACPAELAARWSAGRRFFNLYGPTEATIWSSYAECFADGGAPPIGRPITNTRLYVLDRNLMPTPIGVAGELYIGSVGLARGYWNRADLTAERFIADPFSGEPGARLYRTGDLARYLPDGNLEYLGRIDAQVKIRGFRIELGEIETVLLSHSHVKEAVVLAREDVPGEKRLVAYVVGSDGEVSVSALREHLSGRLPAYMAPAAFVVLQKLPLSPNGKVDRKALPAPDGVPAQTHIEYVVPPDILSLQLVKIWERVLKVHPVNIRANFFELGGNSLMAAQMFDLIDQRIGRKLPLATLFHAQTIEQLIPHLREGNWSSPWSILVAIETEGTQPPLFCVQALGGNIITYHRLSQHLGPDQPVYGLQSYNMDGNGIVCTTIEQMATEYIKEIRSVQASGPYFLGGYCSGGMIALEMARQLHAEGEEVALVALFDAFPQNTKPQSPIRRMINKAKRLHRKWVRLQPKERIIYLKLQGRRLREDCRSWFAGVYHKYTKSSVEVHNSARQVDQVNRRALKEYIPRPYGGHTVLFRDVTKSIEIVKRWDGLLTALQIVDIPTEHSSIFKEPHVRDLAEKVSICLREAQDLLSR